MNILHKKMHLECMCATSFRCESELRILKLFIAFLEINTMEMLQKLFTFQNCPL